jgi:hypothetical protein
MRKRKRIWWWWRKITYFFNCGEVGHVSRFYTKPCALCGYCHSTKHVTEDFPDLLGKWEEKKAHCNMVIVEPHKDQNPKEEVDVQVVTRGGIQMGMDLECGEILGQNIEGKIKKKVMLAPPKFDVVQQKQFLHDAQRSLEEDRACAKLQRVQCKNHWRKLGVRRGTTHTQISLEEAYICEELHHATKKSLEEACVHEEIQCVT